MWIDSCHGLKDDEIDEIIILLRAALAAFFIELTDRRQPWEDQILEGYYDMLQ